MTDNPAYLVAETEIGSFCHFAVLFLAHELDLGHHLFLCENLLAHLSENHLAGIQIDSNWFSAEDT